MHYRVDRDEYCLRNPITSGNLEYDRHPIHARRWKIQSTRKTSMRENNTARKRCKINFPPSTYLVIDSPSPARYTPSSSSRCTRALSLMHYGEGARHFVRPPSWSFISDNDNTFASQWARACVCVRAPCTGMRHGVRDPHRARAELIAKSWGRAWRRAVGLQNLHNCR